MKHLFVLLFLGMSMISCLDDDAPNNNPKDYTKQNEEEILNYLDQHNLEAQQSDSGLYYIVEEEGEGEYPKIDSTIKVKYKGYFTDGSIFDENTEGITFNLSQVIAGWTEGLTYLKSGGKGKLLIPSHLAYGSYGRPGIPRGAVLISDVELIDIID